MYLWKIGSIHSSRQEILPHSLWRQGMGPPYAPRSILGRRSCRQGWLHCAVRHGINEAPVRPLSLFTFRLRRPRRFFFHSVGACALGKWYGTFHGIPRLKRFLPLCPECTGTFLYITFYKRVPYLSGQGNISTVYGEWSTQPIG